MAQHNLRAAANAVQRHKDVAHAFGVTDDEVARWREAADKMFIPYDERLKVTPQAECFTEHEVWNFATTSPEQYPLFLHFPYFDIYRKQVIKQADLVLAMHLRSDAFSLEQKMRNFAYYEPLTVRDSSLSASGQAVIAAEVGHLDLAYDYFAETALMDLNDLEHNARDGIHIAAVAGTWIVLVAGFGGMRLHDNSISFAPRLPNNVERLAFHITFRERHLRLDVTEKEVTYRLLDGSDLKTWHHGKEITLAEGKAITLPIPPLPINPGPRPSQPKGREPLSREAHRS
jgi:alpha,alpha-trehalose phosphorylase